MLGTAQRGALLREGIHVVLAGQPNVGKSSLLNALAGAELAIVTPIPGTTRDKVAQTIQIDGVPVHVVDTAGLRSTDDAPDEVERIGIQRSWDEIGRADAVLVLHDLTRTTQAGYQRAQRLIDAQLHALTQVPRLQVLNKCDVATPTVVETGAIVLSALTGEGLDQLRRALLELAGWQAAPEGGFIARTRLCARAAPRGRTHGAAHAPTRSRATPRSSCWPKNCGWPTRTCVRSPAPSATTTCWAKSSDASASGSSLRTHTRSSFSSASASAGGNPDSTSVSPAREHVVARRAPARAPEARRTDTTCTPVACSACSASVRPRHARRQPATVTLARRACCSSSTVSSSAPWK